MISVKTKEITRFRGDTIPETFFVVNTLGAVYDITGHTFKLSLNTLRNPPDNSTQVLQLIAATPTPTEALAGEVRFPITALEADLAITRFYYDVEMTNPTGEIQTIFTGRIVIRQDVTK